MQNKANYNNLSFSCFCRTRLLYHNFTSLITVVSYSTCIWNLWGENHTVWTKSFPEMPKGVWSVLHYMMSKISALQQELQKRLLICLPEFISGNAKLLFIRLHTIFPFSNSSLIFQHPSSINLAYLFSYLIISVGYLFVTINERN